MFNVVADYLTGEQIPLDELMYVVGETIELSCSVENPPMPILWFKDGIAVKSSNQTHTRQNLLRINNVSYDDSGIYSCTLLRSGEILRNFTVRVAGKQLPLIDFVKYNILRRLLKSDVGIRAVRFPNSHSKISISFL